MLLTACRGVHAISNAGNTANATAGNQQHLSASNKKAALTRQQLFSIKAFFSKRNISTIFIYNRSTITKSYL